MLCYKTTGMKEWPGILAVYDCPVNVVFNDVEDVKSYVEGILREAGLEGVLEFSSNEAIGSRTVLFRLHFKPDASAREYVGVRVVAVDNVVTRVLFVVPRELEGVSSALESGLTIGRYNPDKDVSGAAQVPDQQVYIPYPVIYAVKGIPRVQPSEWYLEVAGLVENSLLLRYNDLVKMPMASITTDFHCVTGWSVRSARLKGVETRLITELAKPLREARWVYITGYDDYSAIVPVDEFSKGILVLYMGDKPLPPEHGGPVRLFFPGLYGWKSVKWVKRLEFTSEYRDGYWEVMGYHPRGRVENSERFKRF
ncbi:molybdopterin-dependent oxidoreductase [Thermogladius sp. KZ2Tp1]|uniref:molybdopterin-dependent oxidoreductase n=1 Tax=Thermogladius sp. KZ2Tp1 TaxID=3136289 RepID=UPI003DA9BA31